MSDVPVATKEQVNPAKAKVVKTYKHGSPLIACRYHPDGRHIFFAAQDHSVWRWNVADNKKAEFKGHDSWVRAIAFADGGRKVITGGYDGRLKWWPALGDKPAAERTIEAHQGWIRAIAVSPDNRLLASVGNDLLVKLWNLADGTPVASMAGHQSHIYNVAFHPDGRHAVTGDLKARLIDWDLETSKMARSLTAPSLHKYDKGFRADIGGTRCMNFNQDGTLLACGGITNVSNAFAGVGNPSIEIMDWKSGKRKIQHLSKSKLRGVAWGAAIHPYGFTIGISGGGGGGFMLFWKPNQTNEFHRLKLPDTARDMSLSPDLLHVATAHHDSRLRVTKMAAK